MNKTTFNTTHPDTVLVEAPARLHFGFVDLNGGTGRRFGSLGLSITDISTRLRVSIADKTSVTGADEDRISQIANRFLSAYALPGGVQIEVLESIPAHSGLGSGTQMALAVGYAISQLYRLNLDARRIAGQLNRGNRSGIGIAAFEQGGFIVDGGRRAEGVVPAVISRLEYPRHWPVLLIFDTSKPCGLHGASERNAFHQLPEFPDDEAARLCRLLVMQLLPGLAEQQMDDFGRAVTAIQQSVGQYFSPAQGGIYSSPAVSTALDWVAQQGIHGLGQSSWGPTGFALLQSESQARQLTGKLAKQFAHLPLSYQVVFGRNDGAKVQATTQAITSHRRRHASYAG